MQPEECRLSGQKLQQHEMYAPIDLNKPFTLRTEINQYEWEQHSMRGLTLRAACSSHAQLFLYLLRTHLRVGTARTCV